MIEKIVLWFVIACNLGCCGYAFYVFLTTGRRVHRMLEELLKEEEPANPIPEYQSIASGDLEFIKNMPEGTTITGVCGDAYKDKTDD